jgi:hypothetical protein
VFCALSVLAECGLNAEMQTPLADKLILPKIKKMEKASTPTTILEKASTTTILVEEKGKIQNFSFENLNLKVSLKSGQKQLLSSISGHVKAGEMVGIMVLCLANRIGTSLYNRIGTVSV